MCICVGFLFIQIYTYIRIILRVVKGDATWCKVIIHSNCDRRQFSLIHFSLKEATAFVRQGFVTKELLDLHRVDELKNFTANIFLKLVC